MPATGYLCKYVPGPNRGTGQLLAKGAGRTSGASMIAGYMGSSDRVDKALCKLVRR